MARSTSQEAAESGRLIVCDRDRTASLLDFAELVDAVIDAAVECERGTIVSPSRMVVAIGQGGSLLSMPATAPDIAIHKLVSVQPANAKRQLPTLYGTVTVLDAATGKPICLLDGPEVTGRRTAAVSLAAMRLMLPSAPHKAVLVGTGVQAAYHLRAIAARYPQCSVLVRGRTPRRAQAFCAAHRATHDDLDADRGEAFPDDADVAIMLTTSTTPIYDEPAKAQRLVIGVGAFRPEMAELGERLLDESVVYVDDLAGARHEAGDLLRAGIDWNRVLTLATAVTTTPDLDRPIVFKSVGSAAWDLAAARVAIRKLGAPLT
jgi:1-piperideine-2-carboxylate/1-pyrroline-2-carboxylate reductase [NAD(P)H]